jgi:hypothetical protein
MISGPPQLLSGCWEKKRQNEVILLVPQSNISYNTIKKNQTLFDCVGKDCFEAETENEEE